MDEDALGTLSRVVESAASGTNPPQFSDFEILTCLFVQKFSTLAKQSGDSEPLYRLFAREGAIGRRLLEQVRKDLVDVVKVCQGELKQTNHLRTLMSCLTKGSSWRYMHQSFANY
jgi:hypothetical protein